MMKVTLRHIIIKFTETKSTGKNLRKSQRKKTQRNRGIKLKMRVTEDFSSQVMCIRCQWSSIIKAPKEKHFNSEFYVSEKISLQKEG